MGAKDEHSPALPKPIKFPKRAISKGVDPAPAPSEDLPGRREKEKP